MWLVLDEVSLERFFGAMGLAAVQAAAPCWSRSIPIDALSLPALHAGVVEWTKISANLLLPQNFGF
jgi:hypothetical protein